MNKVAVIIPVYKTDEKLLRKCITSVQNQTLKNIEIIIIDDGSPDKCGEICDEYAREDSRIKVVHKKNEGVSVARNVGIELSNAQYLSFVDADDWIDKETLEEAFNEADMNDDDILQWTYIWHQGNKNIANNEVFSESGILSEEQKKEYTLKAIVDTHPSYSCNSGFAAGAPWAKVYKRDFIINNKLRFVPGLARSQDRIFNLYAYDAANKIEYLNKPFSHYIANDTSAVVSYRPNVEVVYDKYLQEIETFIGQKKNIDPVFVEARAICQCYVLQQIFTQYLFNKNCDLSFLEKLKEVRRLAKEPKYAAGIENIDKVKRSLTKKQYYCIKVLKISPLMATFGMELKKNKNKRISLWKKWILCLSYYIIRH